MSANFTMISPFPLKSEKACFVIAKSPSFPDIFVKCSPSFMDLKPSTEAAENSRFFHIFSTVISCESAMECIPKSNKKRSNLLVIIL